MADPEKRKSSTPSEPETKSGGPDLQDLPPALHRFLELFNAREYWESHEVLEGPWHEGGSDFYQGLILYASAFVHAQRGNAGGIGMQLEKTERKLAGYRPCHLGVDVDSVLAHGDEPDFRQGGREPAAHGTRLDGAQPELSLVGPSDF